MGAARAFRGFVCLFIISGVLFSWSGCGSDNGIVMTVQERLAALWPAAVIAHRGTGKTAPGKAFPENSIPAFREGVAQGADAIELDVQMTADGQLIVMHDDKVDRTTDCSGCISAMSLAEVRACSLLGGNGDPTNEHPPVLAEVYAALPAGFLVDIELKIPYGRCRTEITTPESCASKAVQDLEIFGGLQQTFFSSFSLRAVSAVEQINPGIYSASLDILLATSIEPAVASGLDAVNPFWLLTKIGVDRARDEGLQVNAWTVNGEALVNRMLDAGVTSLITDQPGATRATMDQWAAAR